MCAVSAVIDHGRTLPWDNWINHEPYKTKDRWDEFKDIIDRLDKLDKKLDQPDCDPAKRAWMESIDKRLKDLEAK